MVRHKYSAVFRNFWLDSPQLKYGEKCENQDWEHIFLICQTLFVVNFSRHNQFFISYSPLQYIKDCCCCCRAALHLFLLCEEAADQWVCLYSRLPPAMETGERDFLPAGDFWLKDSVLIYSINTVTTNALTATQTSVWTLLHVHTFIHIQNKCVYTAHIHTQMKWGVFRNPAHLEGTFNTEWCTC